MRASSFWGGELVESENTVYEVYGGSKLNFSSAVTFSGAILKVFDDLLLTMGGDLTINDDCAINQYSHTIAVDNGNEVRNVNWGEQFSASWDHTLILSPASAATQEHFPNLNRSNTLTLKSGTLNIYGSSNGGNLVPRQVTLQSGTLNVNVAANASLKLTNSTICWNPTGTSTPLLKLSPAADSLGITIDVDSTALDVSTLSANGQKVLNIVTPQSIQFVWEGSSKPRALYDFVSGLYNYHGYQKWIDNNTASSSSSRFREDSSTGLLIYKNDLYYSSRNNHRLSPLDSNGKNWRGGDFVIYDTEKISYNYHSPGDLSYDRSHCALAVGLNMAAFWLDKYAVLNTSATPLLYPGSPTPSASALNNNDIYARYSRAYTIDDNHNNGFSGTALGWILSGEPHQGTLSDSMANFYGKSAPFTKGTWSYTPDDIAGNQNFTAKEGKIYSFSDVDGIISNASDNVTRIITQAFAGSQAPVSIGWTGVKAGTTGEEKGETSRHVVTCWGYETTLVDGKTMVSKLWITDSDDKNLSAGGENLRAFNVIYGVDQRVYLVDGIDGSPMKGNPSYLTDITFMTTPAGMDDMLKDYYNKSNPLYWTGTSSMWKKDDIGGRESQTRLATLSDGWRKECEGGGRSIWAYSTFSGNGENVVFSDEVNGVKVDKKIVGIASDIHAGNVRVEAEGYHWLSGSERGVSVDSLTLVNGSLYLSPKLTLETRSGNVYLGSGSSLDNQGSIDGLVYMEDDSTFRSGCIIVSQGVDASSAVNIALGDGLYAHVARRGLSEASRVMLVEDGSFTLATTVDFGWASITRDMLQNVEKGELAALEELAASDIFAHDHSARGIDYDFEPIHYHLQSRWDSFVGMFKVRDAEVSLLTDEASAPGTLASRTIGSYDGGSRVSQANIQLSEQDGGVVRASGVDFQTIEGEDTMFGASAHVESRTLHVVAGSELENDGELRATIEVEGTLSGSGIFGETRAYEGASIVIGNSPGAASYESLTLMSGSEIVFSVDGLTAATDELSGWGSGAHSVLTLTGPGALVLEEGAEVKIGFSSSFLTSVEIGKPQTLTLLEGVEANDALLTALQQATTFYYAGLDDTLASLTESTLYSVHKFSWLAVDDERVALNVTLYYAGQGALNVPEPSTASLSLLALSLLATRRRRG